MFHPQTAEELKQAEDEFARDLEELVARARRNPPRLERVAPPIDMERMWATSPGPLYEGFQEDMQRMNRGLRPFGPRR